MAGKFGKMKLFKTLSHNDNQKLIRGPFSLFSFFFFFEVKLL